MAWTPAGPTDHLGFYFHVACSEPNTRSLLRLVNDALRLRAGSFQPLACHLGQLPSALDGGLSVSYLISESSSTLHCWSEHLYGSHGLLCKLSDCLCLSLCSITPSFEAPSLRGCCFETALWGPIGFRRQWSGSSAARLRLGLQGFCV